jgi:molybdopterin/thiamine biosynthesis adenylyltransferase
MTEPESRYDRQIRLFGAEGQQRLEALRVAVVGLGGLGSHVAQQLAYLGVRVFALVDHDRTTLTNTNRLVGSGVVDASARRLKVSVAARMIERIQPGAAITLVPEPFISEAGFAALHASSLVVGCMDDDASRLILNEFCQAYERPYMDIATDVDPGPPVRFGGRMLYSVDGEQCVYCKDLLDPDAIQSAFSTPGQRRDAERIYGVPRAVLAGTGPAVVSLNGLIASAAVTELLADITGLRPAVRHLEYVGRTGVLVANRDEARPDCYYCKGLRGAGASADVERYVRGGWGMHLISAAA